MKSLFSVVAVLVSLTSVSNAKSERSEAGQDAINVTMSPTAIVLSPFVMSYISSTIDDVWRKEILAAQEDCAYFVASEGAVRTARVERILQNIRHNVDTGDATDLEIAYDILAFGVQAQ